MMTLAERIKSFEMLGDVLRRYGEGATDPDLALLSDAAGLAYIENPWFTPEHIRIALNSLGKALQPENLARWTGRYDQQRMEGTIPKTVAVVMAGNIPAVGFHDMLCVLVTGNRLLAKLSSADRRLLPAMAEILYGTSPEWRDLITFTTGRLEGFDYVIATGSDNTSRYFDFYFGKYPNIIRHNRNSIAILDGNERREVLQSLATDIMLYFGMGCRSVSKIYVPQGYDFSGLVEALQSFRHFRDHNKYHNNYEYSKVLFLMNQVPFLDAGCLLLREEAALKPRIGVLYYEYYHAAGHVAEQVARNRADIQCVVGGFSPGDDTVRPGDAQNPALWDYADDVDTIRFLIS
jgi:hypothetical protein